MIQPFTDFDRIRIGDAARLRRTVTEADVEAFASMSGDVNPLHTDSAFAARTAFQRRVVHGMLLGSFVSRLVGMELPGPGALWAEQSFRWLAPVFIGDIIEITLTVTRKSPGTHSIGLQVTAMNQNGTRVLEGEGIATLLEEKKIGRTIPLSERCAIITGASGGIGAEIARTLAAAGVAVSLNYRNHRNAAEDVCKEICASGGRAIAFEADVTSPDAVVRMVQETTNRFSRPVDVLVNSAAAPALPRPFSETSWSSVQESWDVAAKGAFHCCQAVLPGMLECGSGRIVNIGSALGWNAPPAGWTAFLLAKAALAALTRCLAVEFGPRGIRANIVSPGMTETNSISILPERMRKLQAMQTPARRLASAADIARAVLFLCSDAGEFITGADLPVCGGICM